MSEPIAFSAVTAHASLPLLFAGQSQKEFFVNQALTILDAMTQQAVVASVPQPPSNAAEGDCYRITAPSGGDWNGHTDEIAIRIAGSWHFVAPDEGALVFDRTADRWLCFRAGWQSAPVLSSPSGGSVVDVEARALLTQLISGLKSLGLIPAA